MEVQINFGEGVSGSETVEAHIRKRLEGVNERSGQGLTRVEVYCKDVNADKGGRDKVCTMEARPAGMDPLAVEAQAMDLYASINQATDKLDRILEHRIGRRRAGG